ncbi:MAG: hypothetical protein WCC01_15250 [Acidimicrobiia bacterium]
MIEPESFEAEVRELHAFFGRWYSGVAAPSEFSRLDVLADSFIMIGPNGRTASVVDVREMIRASYGLRPIDFAIKNVSVRSDAPVGTYEEWQTDSGTTTGRLSTAVMASAPHQPNGLQWVHLHETWLPEARP